MKKDIRIIHVGSNIANNVYLNALFLREIGFKNVQAISPNYDQPISTPEWERADIDSDKIPQILKTQKITGLDKNFERPSWYQAGQLTKISANFGYLDKIKNLKTSDKYLSRLFTLFKTTNKYFRYMTVNEFLYWRWLIWKFKTFFPNRPDKLTLDDIIPYISEIRQLKFIFNQFDIVQAYSIAPIYALLAKKRPYVAFEHGTIRDSPYENSPQGRLLALSYRLADHVFITNNDSNISARKLGIKNYSALPHPIDDYWYKKIPEIKKPGSKITIFCPTRHDWSIKGLNIFIDAIPILFKKINVKIEFIFVKWGNDYSKSKKLIKKNGVSKNVTWINMLTKKDLVNKLFDSDIVLDQIVLPCMGAIAPEGLQAGKPVFLSYENEVNKWAYPDPPPLVEVNNAEDVAESLADLINHPAKRKKIGEESKRWFNKFHSKKIIVKRLLQVYQRLLQDK